MLVQDTLTGTLHEVPDQLYGADFGEGPEAFAEAPVVFDGLGNPIGALPFLAPLAAKLLPALTSLAPKLPGLIRGLIPGGGAPPGFPGIPGIPNLPALATAALTGPVRPPWPTGWVRPPLPYTGLGPRRMYMRCAVWPGPRGLVPQSAATASPAAAAAGAAAAAATQQAVMASQRRGRRRFRRVR